MQDLQKNVKRKKRYEISEFLQIFKHVRLIKSRMERIHTSLD